MFKTLQWRMVLLVLALILLAMQSVSVYLLGSLERYYLQGFSSALSTQSMLLSGFLERYLLEEPEAGELTGLLREFGQQSDAQIAVLGEGGALLALSDGGSHDLSDALLQTHIAHALAGDRVEGVHSHPYSGERYVHLAVPVQVGERILGAVYMLSSLEGVYATLADIRTMLLTATGLALAIAASLGLLLARTITRPIARLTQSARQMAQGDFQTDLEVHSEDEIGQLGDMFNYLGQRLQATLHEISSEKAKLEAVLNYMADGILAVDTKRRVIMANPAAVRLLETPVTQLVGRDLDEIIAQLPMAADAAWGAEGRLHTQEWELRSGTIVEAWYAPVTDQQSELSGLVIVLHDITEQAKLSRLRREFVANVSHELRTPLTTVKSYIETLLDGAMDDKETGRRFLEVVGGEADRMTRMVQDLLTLAQLDHHPEQLARRPVDTGHLIETVVQRLSVVWMAKQLRIGRHVPTPHPWVLGDYQKLEEAVVNILSNSMEFTPPGGAIVITVTPQGDWVDITIADSGIGIPEEDLPRVFERFYRVDKARSRQMGGTGLGLAIVKEIVTAHQGQVEVESQLGKGTTTHLKLPAVREEGQSRV